MEIKGLFNKEVLFRVMAESEDFSDLRDHIYIELIALAREELGQDTTRISVARWLKMNRTTLVELCARLGIWRLDRIKQWPQNRWGI